MRETPQGQPPRYCAKCGNTLSSGVFTQSTGQHDVFTGLRLPDEQHLSLACPEADRARHLALPRHDEWRLYGDRWIRVQP